MEKSDSASWRWHLSWILSDSNLLLVIIPFFSLLSELSVSYLEPELQDTIKAKYGELVPYVYFNKGL